MGLSTSLPYFLLLWGKWLSSISLLEHPFVMLTLVEILPSIPLWHPWLSGRVECLILGVAWPRETPTKSSARRPFVWSYHRSVLWISSSWWSPKCTSSSWLLGFPGHGWLAECQRLSGTNLTLKFKFAFSHCHKEFHFSFEYGPSCPPCLCMSPFQCVGVCGCEHILVRVYSPGLGGPPWGVVPP